MYKRNTQGWLKHFDFMLFDEVSLQVAFIIAVFLRSRAWAYGTSLYRTMGVALVLVDATVLLLYNSMHGVLHRGYYIELIESFKHCFYVFALATLYMFLTKTGDSYSRIILFVAFLLHFLIGYATRVLWKPIVVKRGIAKEKKRNMLVVAETDTAEEILKRLSDHEMADYMIAGVVLTEKSDRESINGYPIVADIDGAADYIVREWVDSVYIDASLTNERVLKLMDECTIMGVPTHYHVPNMSRDGAKQFAEKIGGTTVLTTSINYATPLQVFVKRCFDIVAGLFGSLIALIIMAVVGPIIKKQSPGPILFAQERIGKNGKHFKMYKIRSMYMDAEERKKELMEQNRVKDGMMFKLDFDPRIIGNKIVDGKQVTGIGERIRAGSWDEWPQFFNILKGDMSVVGTRPPTVDEWERYKHHHRARLAIKPGLTGMWQVSGRSKITDFEEVVKLDTEYINHWSIGLDIRILLKTVKAVFTRDGAM